MLFIFLFSITNVTYTFEGHYNCQTTKFLNKKHKIIDKLLDDDPRPKKQVKSISPFHKFVIHFDTNGTDAVDLFDSNNNNIPDYVDSVAFYFDYAFQIEVDSMNYNAPPIDSLRGGDNLYDIYIANLVYDDQSLYGFTVTEDIYENENGVIISNSFITIDNNYSIKDSITVNGVKKQAYRTVGIDAVKITSAHEFHHAIQFGYGIPNEYGSLLMEMSSTWMEYNIHNKIYDFTQYVTDLFKDLYNNVLTIDDPENGYRWSIFFQFLSKSIDKKIINDIWNDIPRNIDFISSLEKNVLNYDRNIKDVWNEFIPYLYFTSSRSIDSVYFNSGKIMPKMKFDETKYFQDNLKINKELKPYQIWTARIINSSINDKNIESFDIISSFIIDDYKTNKDETYIFDFNLSNINQYSNKINYSNSLYYDFNKIKDNKKESVLHIFVNDGLNYGDNSFAFTNPNNPNHEKLFISLPLESRSMEYEYVIYNMEMLQIDKNKSETNRYNGYYGIEIDNQNINDGIYYYHIYNNNNNYYGKFSILRK